MRLFERIMNWIDIRGNDIDSHHSILLFIEDGNVRKTKKLFDFLIQKLNREL